MGMDVDFVVAQEAIENLEDLLLEQEHGKRTEIADEIIDFVEKMKSKYSGVNSENIPKTTYLILSGEGDHKTEYHFCMECLKFEDAEYNFEKFKKEHYKNTNLFLYEAKKIKEA